jgi:RNA polymerase sigma-70 factor (ECF subfamily)
MPVSSGRKEALDLRFPAMYDQLRRVAHSMLGSRVHATLNPTAVVHEAYGRLAVSGKLPDVTELSFKRIAAHVMRQVLCDAARQRSAGKRGGKDAVRVPLDDHLQQTDISVERITLVNDFLDRLQSISPRQASVVELLFFGGLTMAEAAAELDISESTAERDWRMARAWLSNEASRPAPGTHLGKSSSGC